MKKSKVSFEEAMSELEQLVDKLEKGELSLDESLEVFQRGIELSKFCSKRLDEVERKITVLLEDKDGQISEEAFGGMEG